ncbi:MAG TPA: hypothetical protein VMW90_06105 [Acidobacteriota bacterium]|nr:hypothetical protein [Acidobacteriota bacterium]
MENGKMIKGDKAKRTRKSSEVWGWKYSGTFWLTVVYITKFVVSFLPQGSAAGNLEKGVKPFRLVMLPIIGLYGLLVHRLKKDIRKPLITSSGRGVRLR